MRHFLRDGDELIADNVKLVYRDDKFVVPDDGLDHCVKYVFDVPTEMECELLFKITEDGLKPCYDEPEIE